MSEEWTIEVRGLFSRDFSCIFFSLAADENNIISETPQKHRLVIGIAGMFRRSCLDYKLTNVCFRLSSVLFLSFDHLSEHSCFHVLSLPLTLFCWTPLIILYASHLIKAIGFWVSWTPAVFALLFPSVSVFLLTRGSVSLFFFFIQACSAWRCSDQIIHKGRGGEEGAQRDSITMGEESWGGVCGQHHLGGT